MFDEKKEEYSTKQGKNIPVFQSTKYINAKKEAKKIIDDNKFGLTEGDFWILMNETKSGKMQYSGLIISHNGCLKINDKLEEKMKFKPESVQINENGYKSELVYTYVNNEQGIYEVGEVSDKNCKNDYPYAMALKRCFDRVVLKNSKLAFNSIYSDSEGADIEKENEQEELGEQPIDQIKVDAIKKAIANYKISDSVVALVLAGYNYAKVEDIKLRDYMNICNDFRGKK